MVVTPISNQALGDRFREAQARKKWGPNQAVWYLLHHHQNPMFSPETHPSCERYRVWVSARRVQSLWPFWPSVHAPGDGGSGRVVLDGFKSRTEVTR
jgi:hypothetical protein